MSAQTEERRIGRQGESKMHRNRRRAAMLRFGPATYAQCRVAAPSLRTAGATWPNFAIWAPLLQCLAQMHLRLLAGLRCLNLRRTRLSMPRGPNTIWPGRRSFPLGQTAAGALSVSSLEHVHAASVRPRRAVCAGGSRLHRRHAYCSGRHLPSARIRQTMRSHGRPSMMAAGQGTDSQ